MITQTTLKERDLDDLYGWIDSISLSKPKKNINRDFSDATMMAEAIHQYFPKYVELHNYPTTNSVKSKLSNWKTLNTKVLSKLGINLTQEDCIRLSNSTPNAIEPLLFEIKKLIQQNQSKQEQINKAFPSKQSFKQKENQASIKLHTTTKAEELKEVLGLLREKISLVERSIERKDAQIRQLQEIIRQYTT